MPNIEVYGFPSGSHLVSKAKDVITKALKKTKYKKEVVITFIDSYCSDLDGRYMPFLRVCDTNMVRAEEIAQILRSLRPDPFDVEVLQLEAFYEKI